MEVRAYTPPNWYTVAGTRKMYRSILSKGIPDMTDWRFITLTLDRTGRSPEDCLRILQEQRRRFTNRLNERFGVHPWRAKSEFHENEYPHLHICHGHTHICCLANLRWL